MNPYTVVCWNKDGTHKFSMSVEGETPAHAFAFSVASQPDREKIERKPDQRVHNYKGFMYTVEDR